jgi:hypothetical protein
MTSAAGGRSPRPAARTAPRAPHPAGAVPSTAARRCPPSPKPARAISPAPRRARSARRGGGATRRSHAMATGESAGPRPPPATGNAFSDPAPNDACESHVGCVRLRWPQNAHGQPIFDLVRRYRPRMQEFILTCKCSNCYRSNIIKFAARRFHDVCRRRTAAYAWVASACSALQIMTRHGRQPPGQNPGTGPTHIWTAAENLDRPQISRRE